MANSKSINIVFNKNLSVDIQKTLSTLESFITKSKIESAKECALSLAVSNFCKEILNEVVSISPDIKSEYGGYRQSIAFSFAEISATHLSLESLLEKIFQEKTTKLTAQAFKCSEQLIEDLQKLLTRISIDLADKEDKLKEMGMKCSSLSSFIGNNPFNVSSHYSTESIANQLGLY